MFFFWIVIAGIASYTILEMTKLLSGQSQNKRLAAIEARLFALETTTPGITPGTQIQE